MIHAEDQEQSAFFDWVRLQRLDNKPLSDVCWATPNGGNRRMLEAKRMKLQGVKAGVYDVTLAVACGGFHGMFIEFKVGNNTTSQAQKDFGKSVTSEGYFCVTCYSFLDAVEEVQLYLAGCKEMPIAGIEEVNGSHKFNATCRRMSKSFKTKRGAVGWLKRRGFNEIGQRI